MIQKLTPAVADTFARTIADASTGKNRVAVRKRVSKPARAKRKATGETSAD